ncbi:MAG: DUF167 domain-containing protein [Candidatus Pacearchaeota archaeon]|nr:DUF167 domain-containing protein [Candidatus Pacearchaeota archaeon]
MKIKVKVHTNSSQEKINQINNNSLEVWIKEKAIDNKANKYLEKFLKKYFGKVVKIKSGFNSKNKVIEISKD